MSLFLSIGSRLPPSGSYCRLGLGHTSNRGDSGGEMGDYLPTVDLGTGEGVGLSPPTFVPIITLTLHSVSLAQPRETLKLRRIKIHP